MSAAPRRQLRRALDALRQVEDTTARFPDARRALEDALGPQAMADLTRAAAAIAHAVAVLDAQVGGNSAASADVPGGGGAGAVEPATADEREDG